MNTPSYIDDNKVEYDHLIQLSTHLTESQLLHPMPADWTVAAVLAHLAFWDQRGLVLLEKWAAEGIGPSPIDTDLVNEVTRILCLAIPPCAAVQLTIDCAARIDAAIEQLPPQFAADVMEKGKTVRLNRADHRRTHLSEIEKVLGLSNE